MIPKETEADILRLFHAEKWRIGTIACQLGVRHTTVQRVLRHAGVEGKALSTRPSMADPFVPFIVEQLGKYEGLCSSRLFEMVSRRFPSARYRRRARFTSLWDSLPSLLFAIAGPFRFYSWGSGFDRGLRQICSMFGRLRVTPT